MAEEREIEERLKWLEAAVRRLAASVSPVVTLPPHPLGVNTELSPAVRELIDSGQTIQAIQLYRQETGVGLAEAKSAIDSYSG